MSDEVTELLEAEAQARELAHGEVMRQPPLSQFPTDVAPRLMHDYARFLERGGISKSEAALMVTHDLEQASVKLRGQLGNYLHIGPVRMGVLMHIAVFTGVERLQEMTDLFKALKARDYDAAFDALFMYSWHEMVGKTIYDRKRVLELAKQMRTGELGHAFH